MSSSTGPSILLIGASGYIGRPLAQEFIRQKSKFSRLAILTEDSKKEKFSDVEAEGFELVFGSFYDEKSFEGFSTVISLLGDNAMKFQPAIITACLAAGVTDFYPSEFGSAIEQGEYPANRYFRDKILTREALRKTVASLKPGQDFNYTLMIVGGFMEYLAHPLFGCDVQNKTFTFYGAREKEEAVTAVVDVAKYTVLSALLPKSNTHAREFRVPGGVFTWAHIIDTISLTSGVEYKAIWLPTEEADRLAAEAVKSGDVGAEIAYSLKGLMGREGQFGVPKPWDHELFEGVVQQGLEVTLKKFFDTQK